MMRKKYEKATAMLKTNPAEVSLRCVVMPKDIPIKTNATEARVRDNFLYYSTEA